MGADYDVFFSRSTDASNDALVVTVPNGGEKWERGKRYRFRCYSVNDPGPTVRIELLKQGSFDRTIKNVTPNDGKHRWRIPVSIARGGGYQIRITSIDMPAVNNSSDEGFRIKSF